MATVENITKTTLQEIENVLSTRTIVGEPFTIDGRTIVPLISAGFAFGAGGGSGKGEGPRKGEGEGGATGGGAWVRPVAIIVSDKDGVRIEPVVGGISGALDKVGEALPKLAEKVFDRWIAERNKKEE